MHTQRKEIALARIHGMLDAIRCKGEVNMADIERLFQMADEQFALDEQEEAA